MRDQINRYARGVFEYSPLIARVLPESIDAVVDKNNPYKGQLRVFEEGSRQIKGIVYSSGERVKVINNQFIGSDNFIDYIINTDGIEAGDRITGFFSVVSNGGEEKIPYEFQVEAGSYDSQMGNVRNLFHFANLAQTDINSAVELFFSDEFNRVFLRDDLVMEKLHDMLLKSADKRLAVEEFLVAAHKKNRVGISLSHNLKAFSDVNENVAETITLVKDVWGCVEIGVNADADFVKLSSTRLTEDDFVGGKCEYVFLVDKDKLHAGKNLCRITFRTTYQELHFEVTVDNKSETGTELREHIIEEKRNIIKLLKTYLEFRLHRTKISTWIFDSKEALNELLKLDEENPFYGLVMCQVLITDKKLNEAKFYLDSYKDGAIEARDTNPALYCYYLYVNTIYNRDRTYARETAATVKHIYEQECDDWRILWILLYLDEEMAKNKSLKLLRLKEQFNKGMRSPVLFLEALVILNEQPMLLRMLNDFEINILLFGCKEAMIDNRLIKQATEVALFSETGSIKALKLLKHLYAFSEDDGVLSAIISILINNGCVGTKYLPWYKLGIEKELKITKLYEYFMESSDTDDASALPKMVLLYFGFSSDISYREKAYLYSNIIRYKNDYPQIYKNYQTRMEEFVLEELKMGRSNPNMGIILSHILKPDMINEENSHTAADMVFSHKITCRNENMKYVIVGHKETVCESKYPLVAGVAVAPVFTEDAILCFEDVYGRRFYSTIDFSVERIYDDEAVVKALFPYRDSALYLNLHFCEKNLKYKGNTLDAVRSFYRTSKDELICDNYRSMLLASVVDYYFDAYEGEDLPEILENIDVSMLSEEYIGKYVEALLLHGDANKAFIVSRLVRVEKLNPKRVLKLCEKMYLDEENFPEDDLAHLVTLCYYAFTKGKYSEETLMILIRHYNGLSSDMTEIFKAAQSLSLDSYALDERIIVQLLFTRSYPGAIEQIFEHYYDNGANERVLEAFIAYNSYNYFVKEALVPDNVFYLIEARLEAGKDVIAVCKMAYLKFLSEKEKLGVSELDLAEKLIGELSRKGYVFSFFLKFADKVSLPFGIADKHMVEYRTNPKNRVLIHYLYEQDDKNKYTCADMKNIYEGIFVKEFLLFYGESVQYYITEESETSNESTEASRLENSHIEPEHSDGRYQELNDILACRSLHDGQTLDRLIHLYGANDIVSQQLFKLID